VLEEPAHARQVQAGTFAGAELVATRACPPSTEYIASIDPSREGHGMLTCYVDEARLPQSDLAYVGFRLAALETLCQMDISQGRDDEDEGPFGYLIEVPFLAQVALVVQIDLLADVWRRHRAVKRHEASLLDAAVVYAAFWTAARVINDEPKLARLYLEAGPRPVARKLGSRIHEKFSDLFFRFWDDIDFLSITVLQDLTPEHAQAVREVMRLPDGAFEQMEEVLMRCHASPAVLRNLEGLLTRTEIRGFGRLLVK
jgi:hypothetical protein